MISTKNILALMPEKTIDAKLTSYLDFLASKVTVDSINCFHVFTAAHLIKELNVAPEKHGDKIIEQMQEDMGKEIANQFQYISDKKTEVVYGTLVSEVMKKVNQDGFGLVALGEHDDRDTLIAKQFIRYVPGNFLFVPEKANENIEHILVPIDLSEHSAKVLQASIQFKKSLNSDAKITVYHSYVMPIMPSYNFLQSNYEFSSVMKENASVKLQQFVTENIGEHKDDINEIVLDEIVSRPDTAILKYAEKNNIDLLVMGTKGHSMLDGWLGSTIERVIEENDQIPLLVIK